MTKFFTPYSLLLGLLVTGPGLWAAFNDPGVPAGPAVLHFVVASLVFGIGLALLRAIVGAYAEGAGRRGRGELPARTPELGGPIAPDAAVADPLVDRAAATTDDRGIDGALSAA